MAITALPTPPSRSSPSTFSTLADAFIAALPVFVTEANAQAAALELNDTTDASASSVAIGTGAKTFTVTAAKSFQPGMWLVIADDAAPSTNAMYGTVTSYATDQLVMDIKSILGTGTKSAWTISQSAPMNLLTELTTAINTAYATVASHATTSAIWAAAGNIINFTGAETITDFPAAGQAGSQRFLICAAACVFTHAGNITVQGGATYTAAAGDVAVVTALSTTTFKVNLFKETVATVATDTIWDAAGDLAQGSGADAAAKLAIGAANLKLFVNAGGTLAEWAAGIKVVNHSVDISTATGSTAYTGATFKPSAIAVIGYIDGVCCSIGFYDGTTQLSMGLNEVYPYWAGSGSLGLYVSSLNNYNIQTGTSLDADGCHITWAETGTAVGTAVFSILYIR